MKKLLIIMMMVAIAGCATTSPCPKENVVSIMILPDGTVMPRWTPKGYFDDPENYRTEEEVEKMLKELEGEIYYQAN